MGSGRQAPFSPEVELLLAAAREEVLPEPSRTVSSVLDHDIEWDTLLSLARRHRMRPLLYHRLERAHSRSVPETILTELSQAAEGTVRRNLYMADELTAVLGRFSEHGIRALTYKGASLAVLAYGDLALREFLDVDILVPEESFPEAVDLLRSGNYRIRKSFPGIGQKILCERETGLTVDLHLSVVPVRYPFTFRFDHLWNRRITVELTGTRSVRTVHPSDALAVIATHGTKHYWNQLEWVVSLAGLVERESIDTAAVLRRSEAIGCDLMLLLGLQLSRELLGHSLSEPVARAINDTWLVRRASRRVIDEVLRRDAEVTDESPAFHRSRHLLELLLMPNLRTKGRYGLRLGRSLL